MLTSQQLFAIMPQLSPERGARFLPFLTAAIAEFEIEPPPRTAAFLAQLAHESGQFRFMEEIWSPTAAQRRYEPPGRLAAALGNTETGDGRRFKGRGPIQITGRANYTRFGGLLGLDLIADPEHAAEPEVAFRIAGLYWSKRGLNALADRVSPDAFREITRRINGGFNGLADRERFYETAKRILDVVAPMVPRGGPSPPVEADEPVFDRGWEAIRSAIESQEEPPPATSTRRSRVKPRGAKKKKAGTPRSPGKRKTTGKRKASGKRKATARKRPTAKKTGVKRTSAGKRTSTKRKGTRARKTSGGRKSTSKRGSRRSR